MIRVNGRLEIRHLSLDRAVHFHQGEVVFATSSSPEHSLGHFLLRNGKITARQYEESLAKMSEGMRHGKLLVQLGFLSPKDLWWGVKHQVLEIIYSLFSWDDGRFSFIQSEVEIQERITLSASTSSIIMEGVRRLDETARIREKIPNLDMVFTRVPGTETGLDSLEISAEQRELYEAIDGISSIRELIRQCSLTEFEASYILYQMLTARMIEVVPEEKSNRPVFLDVEDSPELLKVISTYNEMFQRLYASLRDSVGEIRAREVFLDGMETAGASELWSGVFFDQEGHFDENMLIANISELPFERRKLALDEGLNTLLSIQLFEVSQHLDPESRVEVFRFISDQKAQLEPAAG